MRYPRIDVLLLALLALLWGSSYLFIKVAVEDISPITLIAARVAGASVLLLTIMRLRGQRLPRSPSLWRMLLVQSFLTSSGAWTLLAWGQQFVDASLASVLNSTSPIFVILFTVFITNHEQIDRRKLIGVCIGIFGVTLIVGLDALAGLFQQVAGQSACLAGAALYACAAIYGRRFSEPGALKTATGTMLLATLVLVPMAFIIESPLTLRPSWQAIAATVILSLVCTGVALLIYFRLLQSLGSLGVASQAYLRAGVGVLLGVIFLGETLTPAIVSGLAAAILGVALINWPEKKPTDHITDRA